MVNRFKYEITADDRSAKGVASAEKRLCALTKGANRYGAAMDKATKRTPLGHAAKSFSGVHAAAFKALGGSSSPIGAVADRLGALKEAGQAARSGLAAAAEEGGVLSSAMGSLGVVAGGTVGVLLAAGLAGYKFASGWVEGGAALGRLKQTLGMTTDEIQKFQTAGERFGVDKGAMAGALGGLSTTVYDAAAGRNNEALAAMNQLGIKVKLGKDGLPDISAMMQEIAESISRQKNPLTGNRIASIFGVTSALPLLRQGRAGVQKELEDAGRYGAIMTPQDVTDATGIAKTGIMAKQAGERILQAGQGATARGETANVNSAALATARAAIDGVGAASGGLNGVGGAVAQGLNRFTASVAHDFEPGARAVERGGQAILAGAKDIVDYLTSKGQNRYAAVGMAANIAAETGGTFDPHQRQHGGGPGYGLFQMERPLQKKFKAWAGKDIRESTAQDQLDFGLWLMEHGDRGERLAGRKLVGATSYGGAAADFERYFERPKDTEGQADYRAKTAEKLGADLNHRHQVDVTVHDKRVSTTVKSTSPGAKSVAIGYAMSADV